MKNYGLIGRIVMWALMLISIIFTIGVANSGSTDGFVSYGMMLTYITAGLAVLAAIFSLFIDPTQIKGVAVGAGAFILVLAIAYGMSDGSDYEMYAKFEITESTSRMVSMGLNTFIILGVLAVASVLYSAISSMFK